MAAILIIDPKESLSKIVQALHQAKVKVISVLETLHMVTVEDANASLAQLRALPGVIAAEADTMMQVDPRETPNLGQTPPGSADRVAVPPVKGSTWKSPAWDNE